MLLRLPDWPEPEPPTQEEPLRTQIFFSVIVGTVAVLLTGAFALLTRGTYDSDEFVYLLLGNGVAHGHMPYRDFLFFHPPGIVYVVGLLNPLIHLSWLWGRVVSILLVAATSGLAYLVARQYWSRVTAIVAGILCAASPIMLITGTRIVPDIYVTFFTFLAVSILVTKPTTKWAVVAGVCMGIGIMFKYPAVLIFPACILAAGRRRSLPLITATAVTTAILFIPFAPSWHQFYTDTVIFQSDRSPQALGIRVAAIFVFILLLQPLAAFGLFQKPLRWWLVAGYLSGFAYLGTPQVYYHYMAPVVPFAAILAATYVTRLPKLSPPLILPAVSAGCVAIMLLWAAIVVYTPGQSPLHMAGFQIRNVQPVTDFIRHHTNGTESIIDDRPEVPVLSDRYDCQSYFWNDADLLTPPQVESCLPSVRYIVHSFSRSSGFPGNTLLRWSRMFWHRTVGSSQNGAFVYDTHRRAGYIPLRQ